MQTICTLFQTNKLNHTNTNTNTPSHFTSLNFTPWMLFLTPNQQCWSTEGPNLYLLWYLKNKKSSNLHFNGGWQQRVFVKLFSWRHIHQILSKQVHLAFHLHAYIIQTQYLYQYLPLPIVRPSQKWWSTTTDRSDFTVPSPIPSTHLGIWARGLTWRRHTGKRGSSAPHQRITQPTSWPHVASPAWSSTEQLARPATKRFHTSDWRALEACCRPWTW